jgi:hypothetical protein
MRAATAILVTVVGAECGIKELEEYLDENSF